MDLNDIAVFARVVEAGSFTAAARQLGIPKTSVSRRVSALEKSVGVRLLHRTTRALRPTDAGRLYYERSSSALRALENANEELAEVRAEPSGTIRITAPVGFIDYFLADTTFAFLEAYPKTRVELLLTDEHVNLVEAGVDLAFRTGAMKDSTLVVRRLAGMRKVLCASPAYLRQHGAPRTLADLARHECIVLGDSIAGAHWTVSGPDGVETVPVSGRIAANTLEVAYLAAVRGHGIAQLPVAVAAAAIRARRLRRVLRQYGTSESPLQAVYPSSRHLAPAVRAFVEIASRHIATHAGPGEDWARAPYAREPS